MGKLVFTLFDDLSNAREAVDDLIAADFKADNISLLVRDAEEKYAAYLEKQEANGSDTPPEDEQEGILTGGVIGGLAGAVLGMGAVALPGVGPIIAAGPLAATLIGAGAGSVSGGLIGAIAEWDVPEEEAEYYAEAVRRGSTLVTVHTLDDRADRATSIMARHKPVDLKRRVARWQEEGWTGYDPEATPPTVAEVSGEQSPPRSNEVINERVHIRTYST